MKIKKAKFVVGSMLATCSLAIVGSITSTFAWYTYNTKTTLAYSGLAGGKTSNLQMKFSSEGDDKWRSAITLDEIIAYSTSTKYAGAELSPVTLADGVNKTGGTVTDDKFYGATAALQPKFIKDNAKDSNGNYLFLSVPISFRSVNPNNTNEKFAQSVYVTYLGAKVNSLSPDGKDITEGLRVNFKVDTTANYLVAPGYEADGTTALYGPLNLSGSNEDWGVWTDVDTSTYIGEDYVDQTYCQAFMSKSAAEQWVADQDPVDGVTFTAKEHYDVGIKTDTGYREFIRDYDDVKELETVQYGNSTTATEYYYGTTNFVSTFTDGKVTTKKVELLKTKTSGSTTLTLTVFLEGWDPAVVDANYGAKFDLGIQFETELLK